MKAKEIRAGKGGNSFTICFIPDGKNMAEQVRECFVRLWWRQSSDDTESSSDSEKAISRQEAVYQFTVKTFI
jgi:hypothetical protein